jgi:hypothetical protein
VLGLPDRGAEREGFQDDGDGQDAHGHAHRLDVVLVAQLLVALEQGEHRAQDEQHQGHHERPEVALAAVAERMDLGGPLAGPSGAQQQQPLVGAVGHRVHRLGQHGRGAGDQEPDELGHGDAGVGQERGDDGLAASLLHGARC